MILYTISTDSRNNIDSVSDTGPSQVCATIINNISWGSIIKSSYKIIIYCFFTERCKYLDIFLSSLQSACEALVKDKYIK